MRVDTVVVSDGEIENVVCTVAQGNVGRAVNLAGC